MSESDESVIDSLKRLSGVEDPHLSKRAEPRIILREKATLDLQRQNGELFSVVVMNVSDSGIGFLCRRKLDTHEHIGLRRGYQNDDKFERFEVRRDTGTIGGYKVGVVVA